VRKSNLMGRKKSQLFYQGEKTHLHSKEPEEKGNSAHPQDGGSGRRDANLERIIDFLHEGDNIEGKGRKFLLRTQFSEN